MGRSPSFISGLVLSGLAVLASAGPALAQNLGQAASPDVPVWRVLGALVLCLLLAVGAAFALKTRLRGTAPLFSVAAQRRLQLVETVRLSHQVDVCLLTCDGREIIVAASPHGAVFLPELPARVTPAEPAEPAAAPTDPEAPAAVP